MGLTIERDGFQSLTNCWCSTCAVHAPAVSVGNLVSSQGQSVILGVADWRKMHNCGAPWLSYVWTVTVPFKVMLILELCRLQPTLLPKSKCGSFFFKIVSASSTWFILKRRWNKVKLLSEILTLPRKTTRMGSMHIHKAESLRAWQGLQFTGDAKEPGRSYLKMELVKYCWMCTSWLVGKLVSSLYMCELFCWRIVQCCQGSFAHSTFCYPGAENSAHMLIDNSWTSSLNTLNLVCGPLPSECVSWVSADPQSLLCNNRKVGFTTFQYPTVLLRGFKK